jgi:DNA-binding transcriptional ArsR family regulator
MAHLSDPAAMDICPVRDVHPEQVAQARTRLAADETYRRVAELFGALADATRAKIVHALIRQELCTCDLAAIAGITESGVSQHLRILRALHVVQARRAGKFVYYRLDDAHVALLMQLGLTHQGHVDDDLEAASPLPQVPVVGTERGA